MKKILTTLAIASLGFICSCDLLNPNNDPQLPPITTEGKGTFGCLVNGKLFLNEGVFGYGNGLYAELQTYPDTIGVSIYIGNSSTKQNLIIFIYDTPTITVDKIYDLTSDPIFFLDYTNYQNTASCTYSNLISGTMKLLKFDITNPQRMVVAGTFEFKSSSSGCQDTVTVTEGRFDTSDVTYQ